MGNRNLRLSCCPLNLPVSQRAPLALMQLQAVPVNEHDKIQST
jgi:hypothetical protein